MNTNFTNNTIVMTNSKIDKLINDFEKNQDILFNQDRIFYDLFENNNYHPIEHVLALKLHITDKRMICDNLLQIEDDTQKALNGFNGRTNIIADSELSKNLLDRDLSDISIENFKHLPFKCSNVLLNDFEGVESALVYKNKEKLYFHFQQVGIEKVSLQIVISEEGLTPQYSYSSLYHHREITPITKATQLLGYKCFSYVASLLLYMIEYKNNQEIVIKDMGYDKLNDKLSSKQSKKIKNIKKLQSKNNTITLKFGGSGVKYINSIPRSEKRKKMTQEFLVGGFYRNQPVGKRGEGKRVRKWIEPFKKCVQNNPINNQNFVNKVYKVS